MTDPEKSCLQKGHIPTGLCLHACVIMARTEPYLLDCLLQCMLATRFVRRVGNVHRVIHNVNMSPTMVITKDDAVLPIDTRLDEDLGEPLPFDSGLFSM